MLVIMFDADAMTACTSGNEQICCWYRDSTLPGFTRELIARPPHRSINIQFREITSHIPQHTLLVFSARAVPQLKLDQWAPCSRTGFQQKADPLRYLRITAGSQTMDPCRAVDKRHSNHRSARRRLSSPVDIKSLQVPRCRVRAAIRW